MPATRSTSTQATQAPATPTAKGATWTAANGGWLTPVARPSPPLRLLRRLLHRPPTADGRDRDNPPRRSLGRAPRAAGASAHLALVVRSRRRGVVRRPARTRRSVRTARGRRTGL